MAKTRKIPVEDYGCFSEDTDYVVLSYNKDEGVLREIALRMEKELDLRILLSMGYKKSIVHALVLCYSLRIHFGKR